MQIKEISSKAPTKLLESNVHVISYYSSTLESHLENINPLR